MEAEAEHGFLSPVASSCGSGLPTGASPLEKSIGSSSSCVSDSGGFGSPTKASPLEKSPNSSSSCVSDSRGFGSPTKASPLEKSPNSSSSCVSDGRGFGSPTRTSPPENSLKFSSSCVSDGRGFGPPTLESTLEALLHSASSLVTLLESPSSCAPNSCAGSNGGNRSPLGISGEQRSEVRDAERLLCQITERYNDCFIRLRDASAELAGLRCECLRLRAENLHLSLLLEDLEYQKRKQASAMAPTLPPKRVEEEAARGGAPKSISIRSKGFLSQNQPQGDGETQRLRVRAPPSIEEAGEKVVGEEEMEVEVYKQGAVKTELCNKWERGLPCPYGGWCRFAHGVQELRPVLRHPRYKTLLCHMFTAASGCPYGHRCHFRHSPLPAATVSH